MVDHLRPTEWDDYIGQDRMKAELAVRIDSAIADERPLDHVLLAGGPGAGKTSLAEMIAVRLDEAFHIVTMPINQTALIRLVHDFEGVVLFDEIHRCSTKEQESLLPLLEFGYVSDTKGTKHKAEWLTIIGATTERQKLIEPLVDRFEIKPEYEDYSDEQMAQIAASMAEKAGFVLPEDMAVEFGQAAAGTPRRVRQFILGYRDLCNTRDSVPSTRDVLDLCQTEWDGLTTNHIRYMETLKHLGGTKGVDVIVSLLRQPRPLVMEWERLLIQRGLIEFGEKGRALTDLGHDRIGSVAVRSRRRKVATHS